MFAGDVLTLVGDRVERTPVGSPIAAALRPRMGGGAIVAGERDLAISNFDDLGDLASSISLPEDASMRCNDGGCDPDGAFWIGTIAYDFTAEAGSLYQLDAASRSPRRVLDRLSISNGIGWSPDTSTMYLNDSGTGITWAFDADPIEGLSNLRVFAEPADDGLCVDAEGGVRTARYGGSRVNRYDASGKLDAVIEVPGATNVTACCFGGPELDTLYITTSRENLADDVEPAAGSVFAVQAGARGLPVREFPG